MQKCTICKTENDNHAKFCRQCGNILNSNLCPKCKKAFLPDSKFCENCGQILVEPNVIRSVSLEQNKNPRNYRNNETIKITENNKEPLHVKIGTTVPIRKSNINRDPNLSDSQRTKLIIFSFIFSLIGGIIGFIVYKEVWGFLLFSILCSAIIIIWRVFIKRSVLFLRDPGSGIYALLFFTGIFFLFIFFMSR